MKCNIADNNDLEADIIRLQ